jgi:hypothetical protein
MNLNWKRVIIFIVLSPILLPILGICLLFFKVNNEPVGEWNMQFFRGQ